MKNYLLMIDSFKGCLTSEEAETIVAETISAYDTEANIKAFPVSDGGEGMLKAFTSALDARRIEVEVHDALMRPLRAEYGLSTDGIAIIEMARASGLTLIPPAERDVLSATTYGTGELMVDALRRGCRRFIIGLGGSATSDAGMGMLQAVMESCDDNGQFFDLCRKMDITLACDVTNPLCGKQGAAHVFAPQKGATPAQVSLLDARAQAFARRSARHFGFDCSTAAGAGAAGGLGYAFMQYFGARMRSGVDLLPDLLSFDRLLAETDVVITGEGRADCQTLMGKLPHGILLRAARRGVPVWLVAGQVNNRDRLLTSGFARVHAITPTSMPLQEALQPAVAAGNLRKALRTLLYTMR